MRLIAFRLAAIDASRGLERHGHELVKPWGKARRLIVVFRHALLAHLRSCGLDSEHGDDQLRNDNRFRVP